MTNLNLKAEDACLRSANTLDDRAERPQGPVLLIGMPCWDVTQPFHSLAVLGGVAARTSMPVLIADINIDFYNYVDGDSRKYWGEDWNHLWLDEEFAKSLWNKNQEWFQQHLTRLLEDNDPVLVAFSVYFTTRFFSIWAARYLKSLSPSLPVMFGGVDCFPGEYHARFFSEGSEPRCDIICQGEAEISFHEYLNEFQRTGDWKPAVPGFLYNNNGRITNTGPVKLPSLREKMPIPRYDLFDLSKYTQKGSLPFYLSRGCVYDCYFCSEKPNFKIYRCRRAEEAFEELMAILCWSSKYSSTPVIHFSDSNLNANVRQLDRLLDLIIQHDLKLQWGGQAHIHSKLTYEMLSKMKKAGLVSLFWGIETGSQRVVNLMNKRYSMTEALRILDDCVELGIHQHVPILIGFPGENAGDVVETLEFIFRYINQPYCHVHLPCQIVVRPNSPLFERYSEFGLANNSYYEWHTSDLTNTLPIRIVRRFFARQAHSNRELSPNALVDTEEIAVIDLNDSSTSGDLFNILNEIYVRTKGAGSVYKAVADFCGIKSGPPPADTQSTDLHPDCYAGWLQKDKNEKKNRTELNGIILTALRALRDESH